MFDTIYELQWEKSPEDWFFNIFFLISAVLAILKVVDCWKENKKITAIIFVLVAVLSAGVGSMNFYWEWKYDMNEENAYVEAYENGEYKTVEGNVKGFTKARHDYYFYIGNMLFDYEGPKLEEGALVKVFYIDEGGETYHIVRVDLYKEKE